MFRLLAKVLFIVLPTSLLAEGTARDAQGMLSRLGYQISVDGSWGPQSQRVINQFYTDRGLTYDGTLSENEFTDLSAAITDLPVYVHPRAKLVNYAPQYDFPEGSWPYINLDEYRKIFKATYGTKNFTEGPEVFLSAKCQTAFSRYRIFEGVDWSSVYNRDNEITETINCLKSLANVHGDFVINGRNSRALNNFFSVWVPAWVDNNAFSTSGASTRSDNTDVPYMHATNRIATIYTSYAAYWGTSPELDEKFRIWWDYISQHDGARIYKPGYEKCREFRGPNINIEGLGTDECQNSGAHYADALIHMGMYYKDNDYINEGIFVAGQVAKTSSPEGFVLDGVRDADALGYMLMTTQKFDNIALILDDIDVNFYEMSFASHGRTVRDLIEVTGREWIRPDRVFDYACPQEVWNGQSCYHQTVYANFPTYEIDWAYSVHLRTISGALWNNPDFMPFITAVNHDGHENGYDHGEGSFNRYVILKYFPPRNQYYLKDPTPEDRNVYRGDLGSSEYIEMIVSGLEKFLDN